MIVFLILSRPSPESKSIINSDGPANERIDVGETVYWSWNTGGHSNSLIPVFARGVGAEHLVQLATGVDPVRGAYLDNTDLFTVAAAVLDAGPGLFADGFESGDTSAWSGRTH